MENLLMLNPSPTLLGEMKKSHNRLIKAACNIFRGKKVSVKITCFVDGAENPDVILLSDLPDELRIGIHDYATRLIAERHQIDRALNLVKCTSDLGV